MSPGSHIVAGLDHAATACKCTTYRLKPALLVSADNTFRGADTFVSVDNEAALNPDVLMSMPGCRSSFIVGRYD